MKKFTTDELCAFLKDWGRIFKQMAADKSDPSAEGYYHACVDAYEMLMGKPMRFYNRGGLVRTLNGIGNGFDSKVKQKQLDDTYKQRAELFRHIAALIYSQNPPVQTHLF